MTTTPPHDPARDAAREREWQRQERAFAIERGDGVAPRGIDARGEDDGVDAYRAVVRALREPVDDALLPADFAARVARIAEADAIDTIAPVAPSAARGPLFDVDRLLPWLALALFALALGVASIYEPTLVAGVASRLTPARAPVATPWAVALIVCIAVSMLVGRLPVVRAAALR